MKNNHGENHPKARLTDKQVTQMRRMHDTTRGGGNGYWSLAKRFGVGISTARDIVTYRTRKNASN